VVNLNINQNNTYITLSFYLMISTRVGDRLNIYFIDANSNSVSANPSRATPPSGVSPLVIELTEQLLMSFINSWNIGAPEQANYWNEFLIDKIQALFSVANMQVPGVFDIQVDQVNTAGAVVSTAARSYNIL
jgi:hypothetical protein